MRIKIFGLLLLAVAISSCSAHSRVRPAAASGQTRVVYVHQQQNIRFTREMREKETREFLKLINHYRRQKGLPLLARDPKLDQAAQWMSEDMAQHDYLGHQDSLGRDPFQRLDHFGYAYNTYKAENVAAGQGTAQEVLQAWQKSPGHNANMLGPNFIVIGIGLAYDKKTEFGWFWATTFGGQKSQEK